jgi:hypothetical protein
VAEGGNSRDAPPDDGPTSLRAAVLVLWIESAALAALTAFEVFKLVTDSPEKPELAVVLAAMIGAVGVLLFQLSRALVRRRAWARVPALFLQLLALPVSFFMTTGEGGVPTRLGGVLIAAVALLGATLLLAPASRTALTVR